MADPIHTPEENQRKKDLRDNFAQMVSGLNDIINSPTSSVTEKRLARNQRRLLRIVREISG